MASNKSTKKRENSGQNDRHNKKFQLDDNKLVGITTYETSPRSKRILFEEKSSFVDENLRKMDSTSDKMSSDKIQITTSISDERSKDDISLTIVAQNYISSRSSSAKQNFDHSNLFKFSGQNDKFFFFHSKRSPFSQFFAANFEIDGVAYNCCEQYMMHQKSVTFNDEKAAMKIMESSRPDEQKRYGRRVTNFDEKIWNVKSLEVVKRGNMAKFSQNPELKKILLETGDKILVEASPHDRIWGIGLRDNHPDLCHPEKWEGANQLGEILMEVRKELGRE